MTIIMIMEMMVMTPRLMWYIYGALSIYEKKILRCCTLFE